MPPPNPVKTYRYVADIEVKGKWGKFKTQAHAKDNETVMEAVSRRIEELKKLGNTILDIFYKND